ncbi:glycosyltransferase family 2 protein [Pseudomonas wenzhouensis]|uniref:glycosyltransferase family 2 protein n=1 Tax=Pseudomonas wenzhouensis TaxID=2906062 RepID=UPI001E528C6C|nr:glycosyltransferase family 2 protein [Pseudomonas wenzhouensis]UFQ99160.1 glycosyltransferase family 2 protein [Pseudomonas wenzhouensis]
MFGISVVIPMYNSHDTIVSCVQSVVDQTYKDLINIIVVNDGSKDNSLAVLEAAFKELPANRVLTIFNKENGGVSSARNMGIKAAQTEWVALLDSDDFWYPEKLERQFLEISKLPHIEFLGANVDDERYPFFGKNKLSLFKLNANELILKWYPPTSTIIAKKDIFIRAGLFDVKKRRGEDCDLWLRCLLFTPIYILNSGLVSMGFGKQRFGEKGLSSDLKKMFVGEIYIVKSALERNQISRAFFIFSCCWLFSKYLRRVFITGVRKLL